MSCSNIPCKNVSEGFVFCGEGAEKNNCLLFPSQCPRKRPRWRTETWEKGSVGTVSTTRPGGPSPTSSLPRPPLRTPRRAEKAWPALLKPPLQSLPTAPEKRPGCRPRRKHQHQHVRKHLSLPPGRRVPPLFRACALAQSRTTRRLELQRPACLWSGSDFPPIRGRGRKAPGGKGKEAGRSAQCENVLCLSGSRWRSAVTAFR